MLNDKPTKPFKQSDFMQRSRDKRLGRIKAMYNRLLISPVARESHHGGSTQEAINRNNPPTMDWLNKTWLEA